MSEKIMFVKAQDLTSDEIITLKSCQLVELSSRTRKGIRTKKCSPFKPKDKSQFKKRSAYGRIKDGKILKCYILGMEDTEELLTRVTIRKLPKNSNETPVDDLQDYNHNPEEILMTMENAMETEKNETAFVTPANKDVSKENLDQMNDATMMATVSSNLGCDEPAQASHALNGGGSTIDVPNELAKISGDEHLIPNPRNQDNTIETEENENAFVTPANKDVSKEILHQLNDVTMMATVSSNLGCDEPAQASNALNGGGSTFIFPKEQAKISGNMYLLPIPMHQDNAIETEENENAFVTPANKDVSKEILHQLNDVTMMATVSSNLGCDEPAQASHALNGGGSTFIFPKEQAKISGNMYLLPIPMHQDNAMETEKNEAALVTPAGKDVSMENLDQMDDDSKKTLPFSSSQHEDIQEEMTDSRTGDIPNICGGDVHLQPQFQVLIDQIDKMLSSVRDEIIRHIYIASGITIKPNTNANDINIKGLPKFQPTTDHTQYLVSAAEPSTSTGPVKTTYFTLENGQKFEIEAEAAFGIMKDPMSDNQKIIKLTNLLLGGEDKLKGYALSTLMIKSKPELKLFSPKMSQLLADIYNDFSLKCANDDRNKNIQRIELTAADINAKLKKIMHKCRSNI